MRVSLGGSLSSSLDESPSLPASILSGPEAAALGGGGCEASFEVADAASTVPSLAITFFSKAKEVGSPTENPLSQLTLVEAVWSAAACAGACLQAPGCELAVFDPADGGCQFGRAGRASSCDRGFRMRQFAARTRPVLLRCLQCRFGETMSMARAAVD